MQLAYSSNAYLNFSIEETIARIAGLGYGGWNCWPTCRTPGRPDCSRSGSGDPRVPGPARLAISNVNGFMMNAVADPRQPYWHPSWIEPDPHYRAIRREHTRRALRLAKELGAPSIQTEPGGPLAPGQSWRAAADVFYEEIMPCVELAEQLEVFLLIEPEPGLMIETFEQYLEFAGRIGSPWVGLNFDIGHAFCVGEEPQEWIARMAPHTKHYHIEDIAATPQHAHLVPGRGAIDFPAVLREIAAPATRAGSPSSCIPTSTIPTGRAGRRSDFSKASIERTANDEC